MIVAETSSPLSVAVSQAVLTMGCDDDSESFLTMVGAIWRLTVLTGSVGVSRKHRQH